ncbi:hypothetical protein XELAEV_18014397mg [Xenopus laevis]|uniref:Secreted protein n=1 Tax=Xenopus laevis TaxID=8355 RepID=A0A974DI22_XENLA|nr:hypothetical protein XELAEV_18014397mg [Xenopus laevis]
MAAGILLGCFGLIWATEDCYLQTYIHKHTHIYTHTYTHTDRHTQAYLQMQTDKYTQIHTHLPRINRVAAAILLPLNLSHTHISSPL